MDQGVLPLVGMVEYQDGSVVSRTILKKESGSVTLFAFDAGEELSEHTTPFEALLLVLDGVAEVSIRGARHRLESGEMVRLPPEQPHSVLAVERFKMMLIMLRGEEV